MRPTSILIQISILILAGLAAGLLGPSPGLALSINDYQPATDDERAVIEVLKTYRDRMNAGRWGEAMDLFLPETRLRISRTNREMTVETYRRTYLTKARNDFLEKDCFLQFDRPLLVEITGDSTLVKIVRAVGCAGTGPGAVTIKPIWIGLARTPAGWRINKFLEH